MKFIKIFPASSIMEFEAAPQQFRTCSELARILSRKEENVRRIKTGLKTNLGIDMK